MVRYLVVLECFLIVLLVSSWFAARPDDSNPVEQAEQGASHVAGAGIAGIPATAVADGHRVTTRSRRRIGQCWRASCSDCLLTAHRPADKWSLQWKDEFPQAYVPAPVVDGSNSAAATNQRPPVIDKQQPVQAKRVAAEDHSTASPAMVAGVQRYLARLGYAPGAADGILGESTRRALADYRRRTGSADGPISETLIARLRRDADRASARESRLRRIATRPSGGYERAPGWVASIAGGFQRLLGHEFDSEKQPGRIREYCRVNHDTWIFDEGRGAFAYCGYVAAH